METNLRTIFKEHYNIDNEQLEKEIVLYLRGSESLDRIEFTKNYINPLFNRFLKFNKAFGHYQKLNIQAIKEGWYPYPTMRITSYVAGAFNWEDSNALNINWSVVHRQWNVLLAKVFDLKQRL